MALGAAATASWLRGCRSGVAPLDESAVRAAVAAAPALDDEAIDASVHAWWDVIDDAQREDLAALLPRQRGLPQEADRQLLLRLSQQLGRPLEQSERKRMRETARALLEAAGQPAEPL